MGTNHREFRGDSNYFGAYILWLSTYEMVFAIVGVATKQVNCISPTFGWGEISGFGVEVASSLAHPGMGINE